MNCDHVLKRHQCHMTVMQTGLRSSAAAQTLCVKQTHTPTLLSPIKQHTEHLTPCMKLGTTSHHYSKAFFHFFYVTTVIMPITDGYRIFSINCELQLGGPIM